MRILIISHFLPYPPKGGSFLRNYNLLKETAANHEIHMLTFHQAVHLKDGGTLEERIKAIAGFCNHLEVFDIPTDRNRLSWYTLLLLNVFAPTPYSVWRFWSRPMVNAIRRQLREHSFDLIQIDTIALAAFARLAPSLPKLLVHQNIESELLYRRSRYVRNPPAKAYLALQAWKLRRFERKASRMVDHHTTVSGQDRETLLRISPGSKVTVVPNGVDPGYFKATTDTVEPNSLIYVGGMTWFPNYDAILYFIDLVWPLIKKDVPEAKLTHIARQISNEFTRMAENDPALRFLGFVDDIRPAMSRSAVYIVPLRIGGGTRLKILDAMSMGKAIVSTSIGCEGIDVTDGHDILIADTPAEFAAKTVELMRNPQLRDTLSKNARETVTKKYAWNVIAPELEEAYRRTVQAVSGG
jgi:glycosyltransferase involved in cell wall biosynthesis